MTIKWRHCAIAERDHRKDVRNYAHTFHYPQTICLAKDFWKLPRQYRDGIILHEIGHLIAGPDGSEDDANQAVYEWAGAQIHYVDSPYGRRLERLSNMAGARIARRRRNPIANNDQLPYGEWIPSHAVKFNSDGTVDLMTEGQHNPRRNADDERPEIHVYGEGAEWTYSLILPYIGRSGLGRHYSHHFDKSFSSPEAAIKHAEAHIGTPGYGGEFGTVANWDDPEIHIHYEGWEPAGIYALGPMSGADRVANAGMVQNIQGYKDAADHFHPIRWDSDYDTSELTDPEPRDYTISPSRKFYSMSGETPPRSRKRRRRR